MIANIYKDGEYINRIVANEDFAKSYCEDNGYTYTMEEETEPVPQPKPEPQYTELQLMGQQLTDLELLVMSTIAKEETA